MLILFVTLPACVRFWLRLGFHAPNFDPKQVVLLLGSALDENHSSLVVCCVFRDFLARAALEDFIVRLPGAHPSLGFGQLVDLSFPEFLASIDDAFCLKKLFPVFERLLLGHGFNYFDYRIIAVTKFTGF